MSGWKRKFCHFDQAPVRRAASQRQMQSFQLVQLPLAQHLSPRRAVFHRSLHLSSAAPTTLAPEMNVINLDLQTVGLAVHNVQAKPIKTTIKNRFRYWTHCYINMGVLACRRRFTSMPYLFFLSLLTQPSINKDHMRHTVRAARPTKMTRIKSDVISPLSSHINTSNPAPQLNIVKIAACQ